MNVFLRKCLGVAFAALSLMSVSALPAYGQPCPGIRTDIVGVRWPSPDLTFIVVGDAPSVPGTGERDAIIAATVVYSSVTPLTFTEVSAEEDADIVFRFVTAEHGDVDFGSNGSAHAYNPPPAFGAIAGEVHFFRDKDWSGTLGNGLNDLVSTAAHEISHAIGLTHSSSPFDLANPFSERPAFLSAEHEVPLIQALYAPASANDIDGDSVDDSVDNCIGVSNGPFVGSNQVDSDWDGFGDACDGDGDQNGTVDPIPLSGIGCGVCEGDAGYSPHLDLNSDGCLLPYVESESLRSLKSYATPIPSGYLCADASDRNFPCWVSGQPGDEDGDGVPNTSDNCELVPNGPVQASNQVDSDQDGIGNACDSDYDQDGGEVTAADFGTFLGHFGNCYLASDEGANVDHDGDLCITVGDFGMLISRLGARNGPSGLACADPSIDIDDGGIPCLP